MGRDRITPPPPSTQYLDRCESTSVKRTTAGTRRRRATWAEMMLRVFAVDVLRCDRCGARRAVLTFLDQPSVVERILRHLGLPTEPAVPLAPARAPPQPWLPFEHG